MKNDTAPSLNALPAHCPAKRIPKIVSRYYKSIENCKTIAPIVDRLYVYDNSIDGKDAKIQFRLVNGVMGKIYVESVPEWAQALLPDAR